MRLLDSDTCIEILRGNEHVLRRRMEVEDEVCTTWITACELYYGAERSAVPVENRVLVTAFLASLPLVSASTASAQRFGALKARLEAAGTRLADADLFIGSIALAHGAVLVSGNQRHYERIQGLETEDWIRGEY